MTKTLWCEEERKSNFERGKMRKVTATKVEEIEEHKENLYKDEAGRYYITKYVKALRRYEFADITHLIIGKQ